MKKIVMIFLDAFSSRYMCNSPFLDSISNRKFYTAMRPMFAFQGIGTALFTGTSIGTNKIWCDYVLKTDKCSTPILLKRLMKLCSYLPDDTLDKYSRFVLSKIFKHDHGTPNVIPPDLIDNFELKQKNSCMENRPLGDIVTLFDQLRYHKKKFCVIGMSASIRDPTSEKILKLIKKDYDLLLIKFISLDRMGHKYGPTSNIVLERVRTIDNVMKDIVESSIEEEIDFVFFSDHGMTPISETVNIYSTLDKLPVKIVDDYILFIGSTVACFWFKNLYAKEVITGTLKDMRSGSILTNDQLESFEIVGSENGELIFALKEGEVFFPDFYRTRSPPKGMHGYSDNNYDSPILSICTHNTSIEFERRDIVRHIDIMPTVLELLNLPIPSTCEGRSLIKTS